VLLRAVVFSQAAGGRWDRLPACHFSFNDSLEAYPTGKLLLPLALTINVYCDLPAEKTQPLFEKISVVPPTIRLPPEITGNAPDDSRRVLPIVESQA
jgi:hypothetical protein